VELIKKTGKIFDKILGVLAVIGCCLIAFIWIAINFGIVMRYFLQSSQGWVIELSSYSMLFICFLGAAWLLREDKHVRLDILIRRLSPKKQAYVYTVTSILGAIIFLILVWYGGKQTVDMYIRQVHIDMSYLEPLKAPILVVIPIGSFLLFIQFLRMTIGYLKGRSTQQDKINLV